MQTKFTRVVFSLFLLNILSLTSTFAQNSDTTKPVQIRRGIPLQQGFQSYDEYYSDKNMSEEKRKLFPLSGTGVWTELNPKVPRVTYIGLDFINPDTGWACGGSGAIIKTTNGGDDWTIAETPVTNLLLKLHSYNGQIVICTGYDGLILRSSDGGETFVQVTSGVGSGTDLWGVQMLNDTLGWVCGLNQTLLKTTDSGLSWQQVFPGLNQHYWSLNFLNESYGMIACGGGIILKTTDGGNSWAITQAGDVRALYTIDIIDSLHIAAAGFDGKNVYSSDGGISWTSNTDVPAFSAVNWIEFVDTDTGYCVRDVYNIAKTTNKGQSWFNPNATYTISEWHIQLLENGTGYSCGEEINIYKRTDGLENWNKIFLNVNWADVFFINENYGYFLSASAPLYKTEDGGQSYQKTNSPGGSDILFLDSLTGFIGSGFSIYKTTDGANNWYSVNVEDTTGIITKIFFINESIGWAITTWSSISKAKILKTTDGGENWFAQAEQIGSDSFTSIYFIDSLNGWATSRYIWQTTDGGVNWIERTDIPVFFSDEIFFIDSIGFIIEFQNLHKSTDNGNSWQLQFFSEYIIRSFGWLDNQRGFIIGDGVYETTNGGVTWTELLELRNVGLRNFHSPENYLGYSTGYKGLIYKYSDTSYVPIELIAFEGRYNSNKINLYWSTASETNNYGFELWRSLNSTDWEKIGFMEGSGTATERNYYSFNDQNLNGNNFYYRLKQIDFDGSFSFSEIISISIEVEDFNLMQNYPNPANPTTKITFSIPQKTNVKLKLFSVTGEIVREIINEEKDKGIYTIELNLNELSSGIYFYKMTTESGYSAVNKLIILK
jgi:photosystem II stability/assembly factor-like uncharacterized protein